ncbi:MAG: hypothetical protein GX261_04425, partial [Spirochaetales bacterium]|nr:hypothetical protein [Spirochaetales bacterium]
MNKEETRKAMRKLNQTMQSVDHGAEDMATVTALVNSPLFQKSDWVFG